MNGQCNKFHLNGEASLANKEEEQMQIKNSVRHYGIVSIFLHWLLAILIIGLLSLGLYMVDLPKGAQKLELYGIHKEIGMVILMIAFARLIWRLLNITPNLALPIWEKIAARVVHWLLYGLMLAMPLTGWLMSSAAGFKVSFFGLFNFPNLIPANNALKHLFGEIHEWLAYFLITLIVLHTLAAIKHHFIDRDDILRRILF